MEHSEDAFNLLHTRIRAIERKGRLLVIAGLLALGFIAVLLFVLVALTARLFKRIEPGQSYMTVNTLHIEQGDVGGQLFVTDAKNRIRFLLKVDREGLSALNMYDNKGTMRVHFEVSETESTLSFGDSEGRPRAYFGVRKDSPFLEFHDENGKPTFAK